MPKNSHLPKRDKTPTWTHLPCVGFQRKDQIQSGYVYVVKRSTDGAVKIGFTTDLASRMASLDNDCYTWTGTEISLRAWGEGTLFSDREVQNSFIQYHLRGEWFLVPDSEMERLETIVNNSIFSTELDEENE